MKYPLPSILLALALPAVCAPAQTMVVNDLFNDTDRIGGDAGALWPSTTDGTTLRVVNTPTATNTQWVASSLLQAGAGGMLWTLDAVNGYDGTIGYFPEVTVGADAVTFTLNFTTGDMGTVAGNLRVMLMNSTPNGIRSADANNLHGANAAYLDDAGYSLYSGATVGGGNTANLSLTTFKGLNAGTNNPSTFGNWTSLGNSNTAGATGYLEANTSYTLAVTMVESAGSLSITTDLSGGNFSSMHYSVQDATAPYLGFNSIYLMFAKGSDQFKQITLDSLSVAVVPEPAQTALLLGLLALGVIAARRRK